MADILCPNCGKSNPDLLDVCQFCQTPLKPESVLRIGEKPVKKNTGELEPILPDWLRDVRQQARDSAEEEAQVESQSTPPSNEPPDLLAGLASQAGSGEDEDVPDWLASLSPTPAAKPSTPSTSAPEKDVFAQFNQEESKPEPSREIPQEDTPAWMSDLRGKASAPPEKDELSAWLTQASDRAEEIVEPDRDPEDNGWGKSFDLPAASSSTPPAKDEEDLSWLHNLEAAAKQTGDLPSPKQGMDWNADFDMPSTPSTTAGSDAASQQDLSWLDRLGGIEEPSQPEQPAVPHAGEQQDLSWLNNLGTPSEPRPVDAAPNQPFPTQPFVSGEDLEWLNKLGGTQAEPTPSSSAEDKPSLQDLSWLNTLGGDPESLSVPPFMEEGTEPQEVTPRHTAPLNKGAQKETEPDWLKSATEAPSMPAPGDLSMDWFSGGGQTPREKTPPATPQAAPFDADIFSTSSEPAASLSNEDVDSLFSVEMPDWLSRPEPETAAATPVSQQPDVLSAETNDSLAPVDLPSWVQAMRPVEAVISETASIVADQPAETEGPLAGLHGVIPMAPIGSARRPKSVSLTLQAPPEQQASAVLLEQILGSETSPRALVTAPVVTSQQWLRWALSALFLLLLSSVIFLRSQIMPVSSNLPNEAGGLSNAVLGIPANAKVLVVIDYEPSLAAEMEAVGGPLLDQIVLLSQPNLSFISTSPNGPALAERLMVNTGINQAGLPYRNLGYLPGGAAGTLGFIESPAQIAPLADVASFSEYAALVVLTDHAESGRVWVEQLQNRKQSDSALINQPLLIAASAQAGPLLQPYVSSRQITGMISGLSDAARYESVNNSRPGIARSYWDAFGIGLILSVVLIIIGSLWSLLAGIRSRGVIAEQG